MKKNKILRIALFIIVGILIFLFLNRIADPTGTYGEWYASSSFADFYMKDKNSIDVLFVGSSNVYAGISPLEIYEKTGITGYSYASSEQKVWSSYYAIREAIKTQSPKVIFLETSELFSDQSDQTDQGKRKAIDPLKFSKNKIEMMNDSIYNYSNWDKASILIKILRYHYRWSRLDASDFEKLFHTQYSYEGYIFDNKIRSCNYDEENAIKEEETTPENEVIQIPEIAKQYLNKICELSKQNNIELVLLSMPTPQTWSAKKHNSLEKYATENNLKFIDLNTDEKIDIDWENDSPDSGIHLNIYGAEKVGGYLSNYLIENFHLTDHRNDIKYNKWNEDLEKYNEKKGITKSDYELTITNK